MSRLRGDGGFLRSGKALGDPRVTGRRQYALRLSGIERTAEQRTEASCTLTRLDAIEAILNLGAAKIHFAVMLKRWVWRVARR